MKLIVIQTSNGEVARGPNGFAMAGRSHVKLPRVSMREANQMEPGIYPASGSGLGDRADLYARSTGAAAIALGSMSTPRKATAARENGRLGGRPRKPR